MEKEINRLLNIIKIEFGLLWVLPLLLAFLYETDLLPQGIYADHVQISYLLQTSVILLSVIFVPVSLRLFSFALAKHIRQLPLDKALKSYRIWNEIRTILLLIPAMAGFIVYYWTMNTTGLLCTCMVLTASLFCIPGHKRLTRELDLRNDNI